MAFRHLTTSDLPKSLSEIIIIFVLLFWISFIQTLNDNVLIHNRFQAKIIGRSLAKLFSNGYSKWSTGHKTCDLIDSNQKSISCKFAVMKIFNYEKYGDGIEPICFVAQFGTIYCCEIRLVRLFQIV